MRWSTMHIPTLRDDPADAGAPSHRLLLRAGYIRQLMAGHYSLLPLGQRVRLKVIGIIREEMDRIGAQEFLMPVMHPAELWVKSGRWELMGDELFRLKDRKGADFVLGMTHEEIISTLATELESYRELPQMWYQFQTKLRDEPRPKAGLMRTREFTMKDSYSFDLDAAGLDASFLAHRDAYVRIFERLGVPAVPADASSGAMGGSTSTEFICPSPSGDHALNEQKLMDATGATDIRPAQPEEIRDALGALPGSLGAVGSASEGHPVIADEALRDETGRGRRGMFTGANIDDTHLRGVDVDRDISVGRWASLREVAAGDEGVHCRHGPGGGRGTEGGHIFQLGYKY